MFEARDLKKRCFNGDSLKQKDWAHSCISKHVKTFIAVTTEPLVSGSAKSHFNKRSFIMILLPLELSLLVFWRVPRRMGRHSSWSGMKTRSQMWLTWRKESTPPECRLKQQQHNFTTFFFVQKWKKSSWGTILNFSFFLFPPFRRKKEQHGPDICPHYQLNMVLPPHITGFWKCLNLHHVSLCNYTF